jgi:hypothetical protein
VPPLAASASQIADLETNNVHIIAGNSKAWAKNSWKAGSHTLAKVEQFKYLGVMLHGIQGPAVAPDHRLTSMVRAQSAINRKLRQMHIARDPSLIADLSDIVTGPAGAMAVRSGAHVSWVTGTCVVIANHKGTTPVGSNAAAATC